jgi:SAM-dependent methyltransferase
MVGFRSVDIPPDSLAANQAHWDERAPAHAASPDYALDRFRTDPEFLSDVVRFDLPRLGNLHGLRGIHLQCHLGTDTLSLARLGARMSGLDFSPAALHQARHLARAAGADITFVQAELYRALEVLPTGQFDLVYTGIGALCWLPDIRRWAGVVAALLRPGGRLFLREAHPVLWSLDEQRDDLVIGYPYFEHRAPLVCDEPGTYVDSDVAFTHTASHSWNHGLGDIITALLDHEMILVQLAEHDSVPWNALPGQMSRLDNGEWRVTDRPERLAHSYTLQARTR